MFDRSAFWSPPPDWRRARIGSDRLQLAAIGLPAVWRISGVGRQSLLAELAVHDVVGPRDSCDAENYALRIAPDSVLLVCEGPIAAVLKRHGDHEAVVTSDMSGGYLGIDLTGVAALSLLQLASEYPFTDALDRPDESARMNFAGLPVIMMRRTDGWRLHVERPWAAALWRWLVEHIECVEKGGRT